MKALVKVTTIIEGQVIDLPATAKQVTQEANGIWFWINENPDSEIQRSVDQDWTPTKRPIMVTNGSGQPRILKSNPPKDGQIKLRPATIHKLQS